MINVYCEWSFDYICGKVAREKDPEENVFTELKAYHAFRKSIETTLGKDYWRSLITTNPLILDDLAYALTFWKTDEDIKKYLTSRQVPDKLTEAVLSLSFSGVVERS